MKMYVKCVGYKKHEKFFTVGKIYEWEDDTMLSDNGFKYTQSMVKGDDISLWPLSAWYKFEEVVDEHDCDDFEISISEVLEC